MSSQRKFTFAISSPDEFLVVGYSVSLLSLLYCLLIRVCQLAICSLTNSEVLAIHSGICLQAFSGDEIWMSLA